MVRLFIFLECIKIKTYSDKTLSLDILKEKFHELEKTWFLSIIDSFLELIIIEMTWIEIMVGYG